MLNPRDKQLSVEEASVIKETALKWPGGLGEALIPCDTNKRGWKKDPNYHVFNREYVPGKDVLLCPVMEVKRLRGQSNDYGFHLSAWRSIRNAYAEILNLSLEGAHQKYNADLRDNPKELAKNMQRYIDTRNSLSGVKTKAWYILYELVDDFGDRIFPPDLSSSAYDSRYWFFQET